MESAPQSESYIEQTVISRVADRTIIDLFSRLQRKQEHVCAIPMNTLGQGKFVP